jgi:putative endonuclease
MTNRSGTLYTGVTNNLERRVYEHKNKLTAGFTSRYNIDRLVYYEVTSDIYSAIAREKQIKAWTRAKRVALIESMNRDWKDLADPRNRPHPKTTKSNWPRRDSSLRSE